MKSQKPTLQIALAVLVVGIVLFFALNKGMAPRFPCWEWFFMFGFGYTLAYGILLVSKMRWVEAGAEKWYLLKKGERQPIDYQKIKWIFELRNNRGPSWICMKYYDQRMLKDRIILFIPKKSEYAKDSELTLFIRNQAMRFNPAYSKESEPSSRKIQTVIFLISIVPVVIVWFNCGFFQSL